jgi:hypothetical protein
MAETFVPTRGGLATAPGRAARRGLRREIGFIGLLWWDMLAVTVFSLLIYFWAQRVALPAEEIEQPAAAGAVTDDPLEATGAV